MLETLKQTMNDLPCISFEEYYQRYVMDVQDTSIDSEVSYLLRNNSMSSVIINKVINREVEGFV